LRCGRVLHPAGVPPRILYAGHRPLSRHPNRFRSFEHMRIAIVGSGISGLSAAWLLQHRHDITLFEQADRAGGHTNTYLMRTAAGERPVDTGFIVYNEPCYPHLAGLFRVLGVQTQPSDMSFGVSIADGAIEYAGDNFATLFVQRSNLVSPVHARMLLEILRFNRQVKRLLAEDRLPDVTLGEFLERGGFGAAIRSRYLLPMTGAIWSTSTRDCLEFPFPAFARFFDSHGLLNAVRRPQWRTVTGGSRVYVQKLLADFRGDLRLGSAVTAVRRTEDSAWISSRGREERFDAVILAAHSDQSLAILADADAEEREVLGGVRYAGNLAVLHTDTRLLPRRRGAWSSWNYIGREDAPNNDPVMVSYWMNRLQAVPGPAQYVVTLNPRQRPMPGTVIHEVRYEHPQFTPAALRAQQRLPEVQGRRRTWFCGAWTRYGFHEDGIGSAVAVAARLGVTPPWERLG
jgi:predicted NAD/FAD-binding protein